MTYYVVRIAVSLSLSVAMFLHYHAGVSGFVFKVIEPNCLCHDYLLLV
jgi:hypothetical protein